MNRQLFFQNIKKKKFCTFTPICDFKSHNLLPTWEWPELGSSGICEQWSPVEGPARGSAHQERPRVGPRYPEDCRPSHKQPLTCGQESDNIIFKAPEEDVISCRVASLTGSRTGDLFGTGRGGIPPARKPLGEFPFWRMKYCHQNDQRNVFLYLVYHRLVLRYANNVSSLPGIEVGHSNSSNQTFVHQALHRCPGVPVVCVWVADTSIFTARHQLLPLPETADAQTHAINEPSWRWAWNWFTVHSCLLKGHWPVHKVEVQVREAQVGQAGSAGFFHILRVVFGVP